MTPARRERLLLLLVLAFAAAVFITGIRWGLPSRAADPYLFGDREPWDGKRILELTGGLDANPDVGADVDLNPLADRSKPILLNATDEQRAEIVRRYRLFTYQPDEWNTMRSLAGMSPGELKLDPKLYQYGGLWVYPVGALLNVGSILGFIKLTPDLAFYLDHPEEFARFYVVARLYSAAWGVVGAWAVFMLARKLTGHVVPALFAAACWACMPVVVNMAHEAKPHLAGLSLMLLAILAACSYVETGTTRWWVIAGALCGAAFGMVISSLIIFVILPVMTLLRPMRWVERISVTMMAIGVGFLVYAVTNPYVWINAIWNPDVLRSNIGTSTGMYQATPGSGVTNAIHLFSEAASLVIAVFGMIALLLLLVGPMRRRLGAESARSGLLWLLVVPAGIVIVQFVALAAGKPGEYGRFALLAATAFCILVVVVTWALFRGSRDRVFLLVMFVVGVPFYGGTYLEHFVADARQPTTRLGEAVRLLELNQDGAQRLALVAEPAPYVMPPVDLWKWRLELLPRGQNPYEAARNIRADVFLRAVDELPDDVPTGFDRLDPVVERWTLGRYARISWAAKPFEILVAETPPASAGGGSVGPAATSPSQRPARP